MLLSPDRLFFMLFLLVAALTFHLVKSYRARLGVIVIANVSFYLSISAGYFLLHAALVLMAYLLALSKEGWIKKTGCPTLTAVFLLLLPLLVFKTGLGEYLLHGQGREQQVSWTSAVQWVPVGLSFYTFTLIGYVADVYKGYTVAEKNFFRLLVFAGFFPAILAGPIERTRTLLRQLRTGFAEPSATGFLHGILWMVWGLFKKMVIANNIAYIIDPVFLQPASYPGFMLYLASLLFVVQIFMDFSAYSDIAVGAAVFFGLRLIPNFHPALLLSSSRNIFWRRWHISLTNWFRDYVYYPLAAGKKKPWVHYVNVYTVFFLTGIWHGLSAAFVIWGAVNATSMIVEQQFIKWRKQYFSAWEQITFVAKAYKFTGLLITMHISAFAGLLFRTETMHNFFRYLCAIGNDSGIAATDTRTALLIVLSLAICAILSRKINTDNPLFYRWAIRDGHLSGMILFLITFILYFKNEAIQSFYYYRF